MTMKTLKILTSVLFAICAPACAMSTAGDVVESSPSDEMTLGEIPASQATTSASMIASWRISMAGEDYVTRGLDARGNTVNELRLQITRTQAGIVDVTLRDQISGGVLQIDNTGAIVVNTLPTDAKSVRLFVQAQEDLDAFRRSSQKPGSRAPLKMDCALWVVGIFAAAAGAGAGCLPCAAGVIVLVGAAALDC